MQGEARRIPAIRVLVTAMEQEDCARSRPLASNPVLQNVAVSSMNVARVPAGSIA
jgi:hypothetical protein